MVTFPDVHIMSHIGYLRMLCMSVQLLWVIEVQTGTEYLEQPTRANPTSLKDVARHTVADKQTHQIGYLRNTSSKNRRQI